MDLESIASAIRICKLCSLHKNRNNTVPGSGNSRSEVMLIGEAPGANEDKQGLPFVGEAGKFLDQLLRSINLKREDVYISNAVKCRPLNNRDPIEKEVQICTRAYLLDQIKLIQPKLIVTLGRHAMKIFFPQIRAISDVRGKAYKKGQQVYLILFHPAVALYQQRMKAVLQDDFKKIPTILKQIDLLKESK